MSSPAGFPSRLLRLRAEAGLTQKELAERSGVSVPQIARYETGTSAPRLASVLKLAKALNVGEHMLLNANDEPETVEIEAHIGNKGKIETFAVPKQTFDGLQKFADLMGISMEAMMNIAIKEHLLRSNGIEFSSEEIMRETLQELAELPPIRSGKL